MNDCKHAPNCKFQARYDEYPPEGFSLKNHNGSVVDVIRELKNHVYVRDVCVRCGKTIERQKGG